MFCVADLVVTHALEWPSLTVQWLPVRSLAWHHAGSRGWLCGCSSYTSSMCGTWVARGLSLCQNKALSNPHPSEQSPPVSGISCQQAAAWHFLQPVATADTAEALASGHSRHGPGLTHDYEVLECKSGDLAAVCTVQDKVVVEGRDYSTQRVILGTHTSENEQNHLIIAGMALAATSGCMCPSSRVCWSTSGSP